MSAWMVSDNHINVLATAALELGKRWGHGGWRNMTGQQIGEMLHKANVDSLLARYSEDKREDFPAYSGFKRIKKGRGTVAKACDCFDYQACEVPGYHDTDAQALTNHIRYWILAGLADYRTAPWGID